MQVLKRKLDRSNPSKSGSAINPLILDRHQHRVGRAVLLGEFEIAARVELLAISTTVPPQPSVGRKLTSVVFE